MNESMMKTDRRGRLRYTQKQKKTMMEAFRASGLSAPRFATLHGVNYQTLVSWIKKHRNEVDPKSGSIFAFTNKRRSLLKILYWDGIRNLESGIWILDSGEGG